LALPTNNRLGWKALPGTNTLAYWELFVKYGHKMFYNFGPRCQIKKTFSVTYKEEK
jgi:hypothetical protein